MVAMADRFDDGNSGQDTAAWKSLRDRARSDARVEVKHER